MVNKKYLLGLLLIVLAVTVIGCGRAAATLDGTWIGEDGVETTFDNGAFEESYFGSVVRMGTYSTSDGILTLEVTHIEATYFGVEELLNAEDFMVVLLESGEVPEEEIEDVIAYIFPTVTFGYEISGDTLTWKVDDFVFTTFTRQ